MLGLAGEIVLDDRAGEGHGPDGRRSSIWSLRLTGAALACLVQSGMKAICGILRWSAHFAAIGSAPLGEPPCNSSMSGCLARTSFVPDQAMFVEVEMRRARVNCIENDFRLVI